LYSSPNIIRVIKSRRVRLVGYVVRVGETKETWREEATQRDIGVDDVLMDLKEMRCEVWTGFIWLRLVPSDGLLW